MRHIAAYLLLQIGGTVSPSADDIRKVLGAVGIEADDERLERLISELENKDVNALIAEGSTKLSSVPSGGAATTAAPAAAGGGAAGTPAAAAVEEEEKKEEKEESDEDMGFGLFD